MATPPDATVSAEEGCRWAHWEYRPSHQAAHTHPLTASCFANFANGWSAHWCMVRARRHSSWLISKAGFQQTLLLCTAGRAQSLDRNISGKSGSRRQCPWPVQIATGKCVGAVGWCAWSALINMI